MSKPEVYGIYTVGTPTWQERYDHLNGAFGELLKLFLVTVDRNPAVERHILSLAEKIAAFDLSLSGEVVELLNKALENDVRMTDELRAAVTGMRDSSRPSHISFRAFADRLDAIDAKRPNGLATAFLWNRSPEGHDYWANIMGLKVIPEEAMQKIRTYAKIARMLSAELIAEKKKMALKTTP